MILTCAVCGDEYVANTTGRRQVTCSTECQRQRKILTTQQSRDRAAERGCPPDKHGTVSGYSRYACRCNKCRRWAADYKAAIRKKETPPTAQI